MSIKNLKIGTRLSITFGVIAVLILLLSWTSYRSISGLSDHWGQFKAETLAKEKATFQAETALRNAIHNFKNYVIRGESYDQKFLEDLNAIDKATVAYRQDPTLQAREEKSLQAITGGAENYRDAIKRAREMKSQGVGISEIDKSIKGADKQIAAALTELIKVNDEETEAEAHEISELITVGRFWIYVMSAVAIVLSMLFAFFVSRTITRPLGIAVGLAQRVSKGDLTGTVKIESTDETGQLLLALKDMNDNLVRIVAQVRSGTDTIATASSQIAAGNLNLSSRTEEQASSLEETASSMEELTSTVRQNADNSRQANQLAMTASSVAIKGGDVVSQVVATMNSINESSKKIVDIIGVIDGIAFQTNILALNAAVEAARAGEQGRGFAVVASEVRSLAQRSAAAAKEIKELISDSVAKVDTGSRLVGEAGSTMEEVVDSVKRVTEIMNEIMMASQEQSAGIEQINQAVTQMDQVTQQNAALVEEAAAAAESMQDQAGNLAQVVSIFKLAEQQEVVTTARPKQLSVVTVGMLPQVA